MFFVVRSGQGQSVLAEESMRKAKTKIEWCDYTINCFWGCEGGCPYCVARKIARRFGRYIGNRRGYPSDIVQRMAEFKPVFLPDQLERISEISKPSRIFISEMGDWCGIDVPTEWLEQALSTMRRYPQHTFITSTKQPQNLLKFQFPDNCWVGIAVTNRDMAQKALAVFRNVKATTGSLMCEPLLAPLGELDLEGIDLVIIGSQTNPYRPPKIEWIEEIARAADREQKAVFVKNNLQSLVAPAIMSYASKSLGLPIFGLKHDFTLRQQVWIYFCNPVW